MSLTLDRPAASEHRRRSGPFFLSDIVVENDESRDSLRSFSVLVHEGDHTIGMIIGRASWNADPRVIEERIRVIGQADDSLIEHAVGMIAGDDIREVVLVERILFPLHPRGRRLGREIMTDLMDLLFPASDDALLLIAPGQPWLARALPELQRVSGGGMWARASMMRGGR